MMMYFPQIKMLHALAEKAEFCNAAVLLKLLHRRDCLDPVNGQSLIKAWHLQKNLVKYRKRENILSTF